jgi:hypothetical protein
MAASISYCYGSVPLKRSVHAKAKIVTERSTAHDRISDIHCRIACLAHHQWSYSIVRVLLQPLARTPATQIPNLDCKLHFQCRTTALEALDRFGTLDQPRPMRNGSILMEKLSMEGKDTGYNGIRMHAMAPAWDNISVASQVRLFRYISTCSRCVLVAQSMFLAGPSVWRE